MSFPGTWMTTSECMVCRVVHQCVLSSLGQRMYYIATVHFFYVYIHDA